MLTQSTKSDGTHEGNPELNLRNALTDMSLNTGHQPKGAVTKPPSRFLQLPIDLLEQIALVLPLKDWCCLRLTCGTTEHATATAFGRRYYKDLKIEPIKDSAAEYAVRLRRPTVSDAITKLNVIYPCIEPCTSREEALASIRTAIHSTANFTQVLRLMPNVTELVLGPHPTYSEQTGNDPLLVCYKAYLSAGWNNLHKLHLSELIVNASDVAALISKYRNTWRCISISGMTVYKGSQLDVFAAIEECPALDQLSLAKIRHQNDDGYALLKGGNGINFQMRMTSVTDGRAIQYYWLFPESFCSSGPAAAHAGLRRILEHHGR